MLYELLIVFGTLAFTFIAYFSFYNFFASRDEVIFDERKDLDGKELLMVNVVRKQIEFDCEVHLNCF